MKVAIISKQKTEDMKTLQKAFSSKGFEKVPFIKEGALGLITTGRETRILSGTVNLATFDGVYLQAEPELTPFVEPFLDDLAEKGVYCPIKPDCFYTTSNKALMYNVLNHRKIPISRTTALQNGSVIPQIADDLIYPVIFKSFRGYEKTQSLVIDSVKGLSSISKGLKSDVDLALVQEYREGDLVYAMVVGEEVFTATRKWDAQKQEHGKRLLNVSVSEGETELARKAATTVGAEVATVKMIEGVVVNIHPRLDFLRFNPVLGKHLEQSVVHMYEQKLRG